MYKKTITYTDFFDNERTEDFYFNLNRTELMKLELGTQRGFANMTQSIIDANDGPTIMEKFNEIIMMSYGEKSDDGRRFIKSKDLSEKFSQTPAYDAFFMEICTDAKAAAEFVNGIVPKDLRVSPDETAAVIAKAEAKTKN